MKVEYVLELHDYFWFEHLLLRGIKHSSSPPTNLDDQQQIKDGPSDLKLMKIPAVKDFMIDNSLKLPESFSPNSVLPNHSSSNPFSTKKDITEDSKPMILPKRKRSNKMMRKYKSVAELEMEEVEGFMDLRFVFKEEDRYSRLASIVPGLKRMWKEEEDDEAMIHVRPYLSGTWEFVEWKKKVGKPLNWKIPEDMSNEVRMKHNLKLWAQTVASLVYMMKLNE